MAWLRREAYVRQVIEQCAQRAYLDGHKAALEEAAKQSEQAQKYGYEIGLAHGELVGRRKLAEEIEIADGIGDRALTPLEIATLRLRQLH